jgi:hypothetical protein
MLPSVNVIYLRIYNKLIPIFIVNKRRARMYWERNGKISKLKKQFSTRATISTTHHDTNNNLLLQPENLYTL